MEELNSGRSIVKNIIWLALDKILTLMVSFVVTIKIANYYGADIYGGYVLVVSIAALSPILTDVINERVVKKYLSYHDQHDVVRTSSIINILLAIAYGVLALAASFLIYGNRINYFLLGISLLNVIVVSSTFGIELYFEYKLKSKYITCTTLVFSVATATFQLFVINSGLEIFYIALAIACANVIRLLTILAIYRQIDLKRKGYWISGVAKEILIDSKYLWFAKISYIVYSQIDKLMIGRIIDTKSVAIYNISGQLIAIILIPISLIQRGYYTRMFQLYKSDKERFEEEYIIITAITTYGAILFSVIAYLGIYFLFAKVYSLEYIETVELFRIRLFSVVFMANAILATNYIVFLNLNDKIFYVTLWGLVINVCLNILLIPIFGASGAAIATVITHFCTLEIFNYFIPSLRKLSMLQLKSLNPVIAFDMWNKLKRKTSNK